MSAVAPSGRSSPLFSFSLSSFSSSSSSSLSPSASPSAALISASPPGSVRVRLPFSPVVPTTFSSSSTVTPETGSPLRVTVSVISAPGPGSPSVTWIASCLSLLFSPSSPSSSPGASIDSSNSKTVPVCPSTATSASPSPGPWKTNSSSYALSSALMLVSTHAPCDGSDSASVAIASASDWFSAYPRLLSLFRSSLSPSLSRGRSICVDWSPFSFVTSISSTALTVISISPSTSPVNCERTASGVCPESGAASSAICPRSVAVMLSAWRSASGTVAARSVTRVTPVSTAVTWVVSEAIRCAYSTPSISPSRNAAVSSSYLSRSSVARSASAVARSAISSPFCVAAVLLSCCSNPAAAASVRTSSPVTASTVESCWPAPTEIVCPADCCAV